MNNFISQLLNNNKNQYHLLPTITSIIHQTSTSTVTSSSTSTVTAAPQITFTSTVWQTTISTVPTYLVKACIAANQFAVSGMGINLGAPFITASQPCLRKRRRINTEADEPIETLIAPTPVESLVKYIIHHHLSV